jgi:Sulfotransferase family
MRMRPVFIVGCPRSGSTMLGAMLGGHPEAICPPEAQFIIDCMPASNLSAVDASTVLDHITRHWRFRVWPFRLESRTEMATMSYRSLIEWVVAQYAIAHGRPAPKVWIDQSIFVRHISKLLQVFPDARFIHLVRDGRAVAASIIPLDWGPMGVLSAAQHWIEHLAHGFAAEATLGADRIIRVHYEGILAEPEATMKRISSFLGIEFCPAMLVPAGLALPAHTRRQHTLIGAPLDPKRVDAWRHSLTKREIEIYEAVAGDLLPLLGYEMSSARARPPSRVETIGLTLTEWLIRFSNRVRLVSKRYREPAIGMINAPARSSTATITTIVTGATPEWKRTDSA